MLSIKYIRFKLPTWKFKLPKSSFSRHAKPMGKYKLVYPRTGAKLALIFPFEV